ncbi:hypothetical protein [Pseudomonas denitrificans (nom. rej.)]|uniref:Uncharacterized protein n=1 Tax=Pseudomonas denitrificans TaxID=43306 RepID=A0A9X7N324_PSEDE|nr:hypothetical protein [Pseudomonas denitrificans (nom. rej.)]QEY74115.1 hypothetical protein F1C79_22300 [Pseudomonas denitrificans (nom. rej.)]
MQLNVSRGASATGKTVRLRQTAAAAGQNQKDILVGRHLSTPAFKAVVWRRSNRGATVICIDECSEEQITILERYRNRMPDHLTIHAVVAN